MCEWKQMSCFDLTRYLGFVFSNSVLVMGQQEQQLDQDRLAPAALGMHSSQPPR
jgi:hypothetical protein